MSEETTVLLDRLEETYSKGDYAGALALAERAKLEEVVVLGPATASSFFLTYSRCLLHLGRYAEALERIERANLLAEEAGDESQLAWVKYVRGLIQIHRGSSEKAQQDLVESNAAFMRAGDHNAQIAVLDTLAMLRFQEGELERTLELLRQESEICTDLGLRDDYVRVKLNMARTLMIMGFPEQALGELSEIGGDEVDAATLNRVTQARGMVYTWLKDAERARPLLESAAEYYKQSGEQRKMQACLEYLGLNEFFAGSYSKAIGRYDVVLEQQEMTASAPAQTLRMKADAQVALGKYRDALKTAGQAEDAIKAINERIELGALRRVFGQIHAHKGSHYAARRNFMESIQILQKCGARYELAFTYMACGDSYSFSQRDREAYLVIALNLFKEISSPKWEEHVRNMIEDFEKHNKGKLGSAAPAVRLPLIGCSIKAKTAFIWVGIPSLILSAAILAKGIAMLGDTVSIALLLGGAILAYKTASMIILMRNREREWAIEYREPSLGTSKIHKSESS